MKSFSNSELPEQLYTAADCRDIDQTVITSGAVSGYELMSRAGQFVFECMQEKFAQAKRILILCGTGNNGGDGYVVAGLAKQAGLTVTVHATKPPTTQDAMTAREFALQQQCQVVDIQSGCDLSTELDQADLIIDALLGTGVDRAVTGYLAELVNSVNSSSAPVLSCDVPTGLNSDTGCIMGCCIRADLTVSFIALKAGMFTADAKVFCGEIRFSDLQVDEAAYQGREPRAKLLLASSFKSTLLPRTENAHKGTTGYVAVTGGTPGMLGAVLMAAKAAYRTGAGRVKVFTHQQHASLLALHCPELLTECTDGEFEFEQFQSIAIGPGLGQQDWARKLFAQVMQANQPLVVDADALNLLAQEKQKRQNWILTPHPGEAARLLGCTSQQVQQDRFAAVQNIVDQYGGVCVLKGSGSLIAAEGRTVRVCYAGNSGQATAGMGDVLTGCIAGLLVQGYRLFDAACLGTWLHAAAADSNAATNGKIGMMATDLLDQIRIQHNRLHAN